MDQVPSLFIGATSSVTRQKSGRPPTRRIVKLVAVTMIFRKSCIAHPKQHEFAKTSEFWAEASRNGQPASKREEKKTKI